MRTTHSRAAARIEAMSERKQMAKMKMEDIKPEHTATPREFDAAYDWRTEPWLDDGGPSDLEMHSAFCIVTAMTAVESIGDSAFNSGSDLQDEEDARVFMLLRPDKAEQIWRSGIADDVIRARLVSAVAQCLQTLREKWVSKYGSASAPGASRRHGG